MFNTPEEIKKQTHSDVGIICLRKDNILTFEPKPDVTELTMCSMKKELKIFQDWSNKKKCGFLVDARRFEKFESEARIYVQNKTPLFSDRYAIIISSGISSFLGNMFLHLNRPKIPTKLFINKATAIDWLNHDE